MKLLQRLRTMGHGGEPALEERGPDQPGAEALPGLSRDDFLDPPADAEFEPVVVAVTDPLLLQRCARPRHR